MPPYSVNLRPYGSQPAQVSKPRAPLQSDKFKPMFMVSTEPEFKRICELASQDSSLLGCTLEKTKKACLATEGKKLTLRGELEEYARKYIFVPDAHSNLTPPLAVLALEKDSQNHKAVTDWLKQTITLREKISQNFRAGDLLGSWNNSQKLQTDDAIFNGWNSYQSNQGIFNGLNQILQKTFKDFDEAALESVADKPSEPRSGYENLLCNTIGIGGRCPSSAHMYKGTGYNP